MPTPRRSGGSSVTSSPEINTRPESGCTSPATSRSTVVLPQPDGPSRANSSPSSTWKDTS